MTLSAFPRAARRAALTILLGSVLAGTGLSAVSAQDIVTVRTPAIEVPDVDVDVDTPEIDTPSVTMPGLPDTKGALVFHGNYCGPGSRGAGLPPVDALDEACMHHDACSPPAGKGLPSCGCHARLTREAALIARSPRTPSDIRVAAQFVSSGAKVLACR